MGFYGNAGGGSGGVIKEVDPTIPSYLKDITQDQIENWNSNGIIISQAEYNALSEEDRNNPNKVYYVYDAEDTKTNLLSSIEGISKVDADFANQNELTLTFDKDTKLYFISEGSNDLLIKPISKSIPSTGSAIIRPSEGMVASANKIITFSMKKEETYKFSWQNNPTQEFLKGVEVYSIGKSAIEEDIDALSAKVDECFQSVSDGKEKLAVAITDKGIETAKDATFETMAANIGDIKSGGGNNLKYYDATTSYYTGRVIISSSSLIKLESKLYASYTLTPSSGDEGYIGAKKIEVFAGDTIIITYYRTSQTGGYIYDGRKCGLEYLQDHDLPLNQEVTLEVDIPQEGYIMIGGYYGDSDGQTSPSYDHLYGKYVKISQMRYN